MHPDDRLWRHPSELARMRAAARAAEAAAPPTPTPSSSRNAASTPWVSRIPTSLVIAAGLTVVMASAAGLITLSQSPNEPEQRPVATFDGRPDELARTSVAAGPIQAEGLMVDPSGLAVVAIDDAPQTVELTSGRRMAKATLRSEAADLGLAAYQVDDTAGTANRSSTSLGATQDLAKPSTNFASPPRHWKMPEGTSDLAALNPELTPSSWGPLMLADPGAAPEAPGTTLTEGGQVVGMTILTDDGQSLVVPWPVLAALGNKMSAKPQPVGKLPVELEDGRDGPTITKRWGDNDLLVSDRVEAVDGVTVSSAAEIEAIAALHEAGALVEVRCARPGEPLTADVALDE